MIQFDQEFRRQFRISVAKAIRLLMRSRERANPGSISEEIRQLWGFQDFHQERLSTSQLLEAVQESLQDIEEKYTAFCPSGGFAVAPCWEQEGDVGELKICLAQFVDPIHGLPEAIKRSKSGEPIDWNLVANWKLLTDLRLILNRLPDIKEGQDGPDENGNLWWKGKCEQLEKKPHRLCQYLWGRSGAGITHAYDAVWGESRGSRSALKSALTKLNRAMTSLGVTWSYHLHEDRIVSNHFE